MNHVMIDIETMGTHSNAPILSIGAVFFEPSLGTTGERFYIVVDFENDMSNGARADAGAIKFWLKQSGAARAAIIADDSATTAEAMIRLNHFLFENAIPDDIKRVKIWANSPSFDCAILRSAYHRAYMQCPWNFYQELDCRTMCEMGRVIGFDKRSVPFDGERHNALDDALHQAQCVSYLWQKFTNTELDRQIEEEVTLQVGVFS